jgi:phytoene synthase
MELDEATLLAPKARLRLAVLTARLASLAGRYEASARIGTSSLPFRAAWAVLAAAGIYGDIARKVAVAGQGALDTRMTTSKGEKLGWLLRSGGQGTIRARLYPPRPREAGLWRRPREVPSC